MVDNTFLGITAATCEQLVINILKRKDGKCDYGSYL